MKLNKTQWFMKRKLRISFAFILTTCISFYIINTYFYNRIPSAKDRAMEAIHDSAKEQSEFHNDHQPLGFKFTKPTVQHQSSPTTNTGNRLPSTTKAAINLSPWLHATHPDTTSLHDNNGSATHVSTEQDTCPLRQVHLSRTDLPLTALASFEGSGNTWTRHLLQQATGVATTSIYCDEELRSHGFPYECNKNYRKSLVVKTHLGIDDPAMHFSRAIVIIRDPFEVILSTFHGLRGHLQHMEREWFSNNMWKQHQRYAHYHWYNFTRFWLNDFRGPVYPLLYSNLKTNLKQELRKVLAFLDVPVSDKELNCAVVNQEGMFHRPMMPGYSVNDVGQLMENGALKAINIDIRRISRILKRKYKIFWDG